MHVTVKLGRPPVATKQFRCVTHYANCSMLTSKQASGTGTQPARRPDGLQARKPARPTTQHTIWQERPATHSASQPPTELASRQAIMINGCQPPRKATSQPTPQSDTSSEWSSQTGTQPDRTIASKPAGQTTGQVTSHLWYMMFQRRSRQGFTSVSKSTPSAAIQASTQPRMFQDPN